MWSTTTSMGCFQPRVLVLRQYLKGSFLGRLADGAAQQAAPGRAAKAAAEARTSRRESIGNLS
jgi:hypothetical protein